MTMQFAPPPASARPAQLAGAMIREAARLGANSDLLSIMAEALAESYGDRAPLFCGHLADAVQDELRKAAPRPDMLQIPDDLDAARVRAWHALAAATAGVGLATLVVVGLGAMGWAL